ADRVAGVGALAVGELEALPVAGAAAAVAVRDGVLDERVGAVPQVDAVVGVVVGHDAPDHVAVAVGDLHAVGAVAAVRVAVVVVADDVLDEVVVPLDVDAVAVVAVGDDVAHDVVAALELDRAAGGVA